MCVGKGLGAGGVSMSVCATRHLLALFPSGAHAQTTSPYTLSDVFHLGPGTAPVQINTIYLGDVFDRGPTKQPALKRGFLFKNRAGALKDLRPLLAGSVALLLTYCA